MDAALEPAEAAWLDEHLAGCAECRAVADAYAADQLALRGLRETTPEPPRDLWARTAAGIEQEAAAPRPPADRIGRRSRVPHPRRHARRDRRRRRRPGCDRHVRRLAVRPDHPGSRSDDRRERQPGTGRRGRDADDASTPATWAGSRRIGDGTLRVQRRRRRGLPGGRPAGLRGRRREPVERPRPGHLARDHHRRPGPAARDRRRPGLVGRRPGVRHHPARPSDADRPSPRRPRRRSRPSTATPTPATPSPSPTTTRQLGRQRHADRRPPAPARRARRRARRRPPRRPHRHGRPRRSSRPSRRRRPPSLTPEPTVASALAIASGVKVVGQSAAFSPDGDWFAFTARPSDGSAGPDVYVWRVGDDAARPPHHGPPHGLLVLAGRPDPRQPPGSTARRRRPTCRPGPSRSIPRAATRRR